MATDPGECKRHAAECLEFAKHANSANGRELFLNLATSWARLASDLEQSEGRVAEDHAHRVATQ